MIGVAPEAGRLECTHVTHEAGDGNRNLVEMEPNFRATTVMENRSSTETPPKALESGIARER